MDGPHANGNGRVAGSLMSQEAAKALCMLMHHGSGEIPQTAANHSGILELSTTQMVEQTIEDEADDSADSCRPTAYGSNREMLSNTQVRNMFLKKGFEGRQTIIVLRMEPKDSVVGVPAEPTSPSQMQPFQRAKSESAVSDTELVACTSLCSLKEAELADLSSQPSAAWRRPGRSPSPAAHRHPLSSIFSKSRRGTTPLPSPLRMIASDTIPHSTGTTTETQEEKDTSGRRQLGSVPGKQRKGSRRRVLQTMATNEEDTVSFARKSTRLRTRSRTQTITDREDGSEEADTATNQAVARAPKKPKTSKRKGNAKSISIYKPGPFDIVLERMSNRPVEENHNWNKLVDDHMHRYTEAKSAKNKKGNYMLDIARKWMETGGRVFKEVQMSQQAALYEEYDEKGITSLAKYEIERIRPRPTKDDVCKKKDVLIGSRGQFFRRAWPGNDDYANAIDTAVASYDQRPDTMSVDTWVNSQVTTILYQFKAKRCHFYKLLNRSAKNGWKFQWERLAEEVVFDVTGNFIRRETGLVQSPELASIRVRGLLPKHASARNRTVAEENGPSFATRNSSAMSQTSLKKRKLNSSSVDRDRPNKKGTRDTSMQLMAEAMKKPLLTLKSQPFLVENPQAKRASLLPHEESEGCGSPGNPKASILFHKEAPIMKRGPLSLVGRLPDSSSAFQSPLGLEEASVGIDYDDSTPITNNVTRISLQPNTKVTLLPRVNHNNSFDEQCIPQFEARYPPHSFHYRRPAMIPPSTFSGSRHPYLATVSPENLPSAPYSSSVAGAPSHGSHGSHAVDAPIPIGTNGNWLQDPEDGAH